MAKEEITPSEWQIMEVLWACGEPLTSSEVYKRMQGYVDEDGAGADEPPEPEGYPWIHRG